MFLITVKGYRIEARAVDVETTEITINGKPYDIFYGNHLDCPGQLLRPLADDIRAGFVPFVGWPEDNEDDKIFSEAIHWNGDPEDSPVPEIPFLGEPVEYPEGIF